MSAQSSANEYAASSDSRESRHLWRIALWSLAALTVLRWIVLALSPLELHGDEAQYWVWSQSLEFGYFTKPPLIAWIIAATTGLFGDGPLGVRFAAPLCHGIAAFFVGLAGRDLSGGERQGERIGALAMLAYAILPAVSFSSLIMSTDAPLLALWAVALWAFVRMLRTRAFGWALVTGLAIAIGFNAKYAMGFFLLCAGLYTVTSSDARWVWRNWRGLVVLVVGLSGLAPNLLWNMVNGWATVGHTADNANWAGPLVHLDKGFAFLASQFGVFGPILFGVLMIVLWRSVRGRVTPDIRMGLMFAAPVLGLITIQAFLSRAHANWAATAYVGASIVVMVWLANPRLRMWLRASFALHGFVAAGLYVFVVLADQMPWPNGRDPFAALRGWSAAGAAVGDRLTVSGGDRIVLGDDRMLMASLIHATRDTDLQFAAWDADGVPGNHFELTMPYDRIAMPPALLVNEYPDRTDITDHFAFVGEQIVISVPIGDGLDRTLYVTPLN